MAEKRGSLGKEKKSKSKTKKKTSGKTLKDMILSRAESGHLIAKHRHEPSAEGMSPEDEDHVVPEGGMDNHIAEHMPPQAGQAVAAPAPQPGAQMMGGM